MIDRERGMDVWRPAAARIAGGRDLGAYELPLSSYLGRRVVPIRTDGDFARMMSAHPQASAVLMEDVLGQVPDRVRFRVLSLDRLNFDQIVLVSRSPDAPRPDARP